MTRSPDFGPVYRIGECDQCHTPAAALLAFEEDEPGDWEYCEPCIRKLAARRRARQKARAGVRS